MAGECRNCPGKPGGKGGKAKAESGKRKAENTAAERTLTGQAFGQIVAKGKMHFARAILAFCPTVFAAYAAKSLKHRYR
jgi:hypothetical protein